MFVLCLILFCASTGASKISQYPDIKKPLYSIESAEKHFSNFIVNFSKTYLEENEKQMRFEIFKGTLHKINTRNSDPEETSVFDIAEYADLTTEEFAKRYTGADLSLVTDDIPVIKVEGPETIPLPESFDWRNYNAVTGVKNQNCSDCWAFATVGILEGAFAIKHNQLVNFSEQQLVDCGGNDGCSGGYVSGALKYLKKSGGIEASTNYPYEGTKKACRFDSSKVTAKVENAIRWYITNEDYLRQILVTSGPVALNINAGGLEWHSSHIVSKCDSNKASLNHFVVLVGYGTENGIPYWTIKNSWGTGFGENGYAKLKRGINVCGLMNDHITTVTVV